MCAASTWPTPPPSSFTRPFARWMPCRTNPAWGQLRDAPQGRHAPAFCPLRIPLSMDAGFFTDDPMSDALWLVPLSLFDPGWVDRMRDSTSFNRFSPEAAILTAVFFGGFALFVALGFLFKSRAEKQTRHIPLSWITDKDKIDGIFAMALRHRSKIRVSFSREETASAFTGTALVDVLPSGLVLEMSASVRANRAWIGKLVECDFRLRLDPKKEHWSFYNFVAEIKDVAVRPDDCALVTVSMPSRLEMEQKRAFLRVNPPRRDVKECDIWPPAHFRAEGRRLEDPATWERPHLGLTEATAPDIEIKDISGGGMRLFLRADALRSGQGLLEVGRRIYLSLRLADPGAPEGAAFYLSCRVQNIYPGDGPESGKAFGLRFVGFGEPDPEHPPLLVWRPPHGGGVPAVDEWAYRKHLELYRSRGG
ncbi:hypothetical protein GD605_11600 [Desulfolutivibrio sulfoxidireducens]|nr:hypothetical protein GD605_11600 [Desulfolutivibrio sulfoxidireducens]